MNRQVVLLNLVLLMLAAWVAWFAWSRWQTEEVEQQAVLAQVPAPVEQAPPPPAPDAPEVRPADYIDVAQQTLFSSDRDPTVILEVEPPPPPPPPPVRPPLPVYFGQMAFAEPVILLSINGEKQKSFQIGEQVGEFTIAGFDRDQLTLEWREEEIVADLGSLRASEQAPQQAPQAAARPADPPKPRANVSKMGAEPTGEPQLGRQSGPYRLCVPGDSSPAGTMLEGYRKVINTTLMGSECHWEQIR